MKNISALFLFLFACFSTDCFSQTILNKKESKNRIAILLKYIEEENFEKAIFLYEKKDSLINETKLKKKDSNLYLQIKLSLEEKRIVFKENHNILREYITAYEQNKFEESFSISTLELTTLNAYSEDINSLEFWFEKIQNVKEKCKKNNLKIGKWNTSFNQGNFEDIFEILYLSNCPETPFFKKDLEKLNKLKTKLKPINENYKKVKEIKVTTPNKLIKKIRYTSLDYETSINLSKQLDSSLSDINKTNYKLDGQNPKLESQIAQTKKKLINEIDKLKKYQKVNKPLTTDELKSIIFGNSKLTFDIVEKYCQPVSSLKFYETGFLYDLDVARFFDLSQYDSDLKRDIYKETEDYKARLESLKELKKKSLTSFFCLKVNVDLNYGNIGENGPVTYNIEKGGIEINLGHYNKVLGGLPKVYEQHFEMKSIPVRKIQSRDLYGNFVNDPYYYRQMIFLKTDKTSGLKFEENRKNVNIMALFKIPKIETEKVQTGTQYSYWHIAKIPTVRIIVYNKVSKEIYIQQVF